LVREDADSLAQFGKCVDTVNVVGDAVTVTFKDGTTETADMALGCDGSHSKVREFLVGHEAAQLEPVDLTMINFVKGKYTADEARLLQTLHPVFKIAAHPEKPGNGMLAGEHGHTACLYP
jgi:2-polyprenyl-6-methoxyphenol hydroxylase-like FAD-dependent oxidoreductase